MTKKTAFICSLCLSVSLPLSLSAQTVYWTGTGGTNEWSNTGNFNPAGALPNGASLVFNGAGGTSSNNLTGKELEGIIFTDAAGAYSLSGNSLVLKVSSPGSAAEHPYITNSGVHQQMLNFSGGDGRGIILRQSTVIQGSFNITSPLTFDAGQDSFTDIYLTFDVGAEQETSVSGDIRQADSSTRGTIFKTGSGTLTLSGTNVITPGSLLAGGVDIYDGTVVLASSGAASNRSSFRAKAPEALLQINAGVVVDGNSVVEAHNGGTIKNAGTIIRAANRNLPGVQLSIINAGDDANTTLENLATGLIRGSHTGGGNGVLVGIGAKATITNHGQILSDHQAGIRVADRALGGIITNKGAGVIEGNAHGIWASISNRPNTSGLTIHNAGSAIRTTAGSANAHSAIYLENNHASVLSTIQNNNTITGGDYGIYLTGSGWTILSNYRLINASADATAAIWSDVQRITFHNTGPNARIEGDVMLLGTGTQSAYLEGASYITGNLEIAGTASTLALISSNATPLRYSQAVGGDTLFVGTLLKQGTGTWIIDTPDFTNIRGTILEQGTLQVDSTISGGASVMAGAALTGTGEIAGEVSVMSGGSLFGFNATGNALTIGGLKLLEGGSLYLSLQNPPGKLNVDGNISLQALSKMELLDASTLAAGTYHLFDYDGMGSTVSISSKVLFGEIKGGYELSIDTSHPTQVNLISTFTGRQYWNGAQTTADGTIHGGSGAVTSSGTNWTNSTGTASSHWVAGHTAIFGGSQGGTVELTESFVTNGIEVTANDYTFTTSSIGNFFFTGDALFNIAEDASADLQVSVISGLGLVKSGEGTLQLSSANTFNTGLTVNGGVLEVNHNSALHQDTSAGTLAEINGEGSTLRILSGITPSANAQRWISVNDGGLLENHGIITGIHSIQGDDGRVLNTGTISVGINLSGEAASIVNEGTIQASISMDEGGTLINQEGGSILQSLPTLAAVSMSGGPSSLTNDVNSTIEGSGTAIEFGTGTILNRGTITGGIYSITAQGNVNLTNIGAIIGNIALGNSQHQVTLLEGSSITGDLNIGTNMLSTLTLTGDDEQLYSDAVSGMTTFFGALVKEGEGRWTIDRALSYAQSAQVLEGDLHVTNVLGVVAGGLSVHSGATLGGEGWIVGRVSVLSGGLLYATEGSLNVYALDLEDGSRARFALGTTESKVTVTTDISLGNTPILELTTGAGFGIGNYEVFSFEGEITTPDRVVFASGPLGYNLEFIVNEADGTAHIQVSQAGVQFWNGAETTVDGSVHGGSGIWGSGTQNWTNAGGTLAQTWNGETAVFSGTAGTVTVSGQQQVAELQFTDADYTLTGSGSLLISAVDTVALVGDGVEATLDLSITGSGGLQKTGAGTLILSGANSYSQGLAVYNGTLVIANNTAWGTMATATVNGSNSLLQIENNITTTAAITLLSGAELQNAGTLLGSVDIGTDSTTVNTGNIFNVGNAAITTGSATAVLNNSGDISATAASAVIFTEAGSIINLPDGSITGQHHAIHLAKGGTVTNAGSIKSIAATDPVAIRSDSGNVTLANTGEIIGSVELATGAHTISLFSDSLIDGDLTVGSSASATLTIAGNSGDEQTYSSIVTGITTFFGALIKEGEDTWVLDRDFTNTASATVSEGRLHLDGIALSGAVRVKDEAILSGTGELTGAAIIESGGRLEVEGAAMEIFSLELQAGSISQFQLGSASHAIANTGDLTIADAALFELVNGLDFNSGTYRLFNYTGSLSLNEEHAYFSTAPAGYNLVLDTATVGEINLLVNFDGLQFWNGTQTTPNGNVNSGSGIWESDTKNWTTETGNASTAWGNLTAVFGGTVGGTVTLSGDQQITGLHFATDGYEITGSDALILAEAETEMRINSGLDAHISADLTGSGGLLKTGAGTITLSGVSDYSGDTIITAGTLRQGAAGAFVDRGSYVLHGGVLDLNDHALTASALSGSGGGVNLGNAALTIDQSQSTSFSGSFIGSGEIIKQGSGTLALTGDLLHTGATRVEEGTLEAGNMLSSTLEIRGGAFNPGGSVGQTIVVGGLVLDGGELRFDLAAGNYDRILVADEAAQLLSATQLTFNAPELGSGFYLLIDGLTSGWDLNLLSISGITDGAPRLVLSNDGSELYLSVYHGELISGQIIQNSAPVGTPTTAHFLVKDAVVTGGPSESNTILSITFDPQSYLKVSNDLTVTSGSFTVLDSAALITGGHLIAPNDFRKLGSGALTIESDVQVGGSTHLERGVLFVNGNFASPGGFRIYDGAWLGGSGVITGDLYNTGFLNPGNSPGTLTIRGNYRQSPSGTLVLEVASRSSYDQLHVSGRAHLDGTLDVWSNSLTYGQKVPFLRAGSIRGKFDRIEMPSGFRGRLLTNGGKGTLLVAPESYTQLAATPNQRAVARALDRFIPEAGNDRAEISLALDLQSADEYTTAFAQIAPTFYESLGNVRVEQAFGLLQQLDQLLNIPKTGAFRASGIEAVLLKDRDGKNIIAPAEQANPRWSVWAQGTGIFAKVPGVQQLPSYRFDSGGFLAGGDYRWSDQFSTGFYTGYQHTRASSTTDGRTQIDSTQLGAYATYNNGGLRANAVIGGAFDAYDIRRNIDFSNIDRTARSRPDGGVFNTALNLGYDWQIGGLTLGPIAGLQYTRARVDGLTETGANSLNLRLDRQHIESLRSVLGARVAYTWQLSEDIALIPELRVSWQHEYLNGSRDITSALDSGSLPSFSYTTAGNGSRDRVFSGAGVHAILGDRWNANLFYNATFGQGDTLVNMVSGGVSWKF